MRDFCCVFCARFLNRVSYTPCPVLKSTFSPICLPPCFANNLNEKYMTYSQSYYVQLRMNIENISAISPGASSSNSSKVNSNIFTPLTRKTTIKRYRRFMSFMMWMVFFCPSISLKGNVFTRDFAPLAFSWLPLSVLLLANNWRSNLSSCFNSMSSATP